MSYEFKRLLTPDGSTTITSNGTYDVTDFASAEVSVSGGGGGAVTKDINFYDYDGTLVESWYLSELQSKTALPDNPAHAGLTAQGWNWSLGTLKSTNMPVSVGQMYITDDGKTRLNITIATEGRMTIPLYFTQTVTNGVTIDWGDGSATETLSGVGGVNASHTYVEIGDYSISLEVTSGCTMTLGAGDSPMGNISVYKIMLKSVYFGSSVTTIGPGVFSGCYALSNITLPSRLVYINYNAFNSCYRLTNVTLPSGTNLVGSNMFSYCYALTNIMIPSSVSILDSSAFSGCTALTSALIPSGVRNLKSNAFSSCARLTNVSIAEGVMTISDSAFSYCRSLTNVTIPTSVTSIGNSVFSGCTGLTNMTIPASVTSIGNSAFSGCYNLINITMPINITSIGSSMLSDCYALTSVTIPASVTSIGNSAFSGCSGMAKYHFLSTTPPVLASSAVFRYIPSDCVIYVPMASVDAYKAATNWSTYADKIQGE